MCSEFAINTRNAEKYQEVIPTIRVGILKDVLVCDTVATEMAQQVIISVENNDALEVRRWAQSFLDYLNIKFPKTELTLKNALKELVDIR